MLPPPHLVTVASYTPRKNYELLIAALAQITDLEWQATWAGAAPEGETRRLQELLHTHGLTDRVRMTGPSTTWKSHACGGKVTCWFSLPGLRPTAWSSPKR
ncbi:glycosyltransferase [Ornithinimicrobium sp. INDO-MA30-4]|uniref:glycosyltransferase n=1 Tax=Ornithinimicrobium sp. INDO-MA30-4 TaxID=2908651 RepID=UPI001F27EFD4|nr:hypothetical protein [Ornithinimicrobium sp. INDO-MA30-4]UJH70871.1 hypothetical protein L0A91_02430 [Ornithinimicrobium sp. INDO-MA30-4]